MELILKRWYGKEGVNGVLFHNQNPICCMIELPWLFNLPRISCIPRGRYELEERYNEKFERHWEVKNVPNRRNILIHPANNAKAELRGCLAPVTKLTSEGQGTHSLKAMNKLRSLLSTEQVKKERVYLTII